MPRIAAAAIFVLTAGRALAQVPAGVEFRVNTYTSSHQRAPRAAFDGAGRFVVTWVSDGQDGSSTGIFAARFGVQGTPLTAEFRVNATTASAQSLPDVSVDRSGGFAITWSGAGSDGAFDIFGRPYDPAGVATGDEFRVNTFTTDTQYRSAVASMTNGEFVVTWSSHPDYPLHSHVLARRYDRGGNPLGPEFLVSEPAPGKSVAFPAIAADPEGAFVIVWKERFAVPPAVVVGRRFDRAGAPVGGQFQVTASGGIYFAFPSVAMAADRSFVVVWEHSSGDGSGYGILGRRFSAGGSPVGGEFVANQYTAGDQRLPRVAGDDSGGFVVTWQDMASATLEVDARRFDASGMPRSGDFRANTYTAGLQGSPDVAVDEVGNFVVSWTSQGQDGDGYGVFAQGFGGLFPAAASMDTLPGQPSDGNGVWEPGEAADLRPSWRNMSGASQSMSGGLADIAGPPGAAYGITDGSGAYGTVPDGAVGACSDCYGVGVSSPPSRPAVHWDATVLESITPDTQGQRKRWRLHIGDSFADVSRASPFYRFTEVILHHGITTGCAAGSYCPGGATTRDQTAVLVLVAKEGAGYQPPACVAPPFDDVPAGSPFCPFIQEAARRGIVAGCGGDSYCPSQPVTREQMAVFALRTRDPLLDPPACTTPLFSDVPASSPFCRWIEELVRRGVVAGCGPGIYCPRAPLSREQMAVFIAATFGLQLYGP